MPVPFTRHRTSSNTTASAPAAMALAAGALQASAAVDSVGAQSAIKDFLPRLVTALGIPGLSTDPGAIDVRFNVKPADPVSRAPFSLQLGAKTSQPVLFDPLVANVPSDRRSSVADSVTKTLDDFALASDSAAVVRAKSVLVEPAVGYGRYLLTGASELRMDAEVRYRYSNNESIMENRWVAAVTLTQRITGQSSTILTLKWANKPEYLGAVDKKLRANIGLSYKLPGSQLHRRCSPAIVGTGATPTAASPKDHRCDTIRDAAPPSSSSPP